MWCVQVAKDVVRGMYEEVCQANFQCDDLDGMFIAIMYKLPSLAFACIREDGVGKRKA